MISHWIAPIRPRISAPVFDSIRRTKAAPFGAPLTGTPPKRALGKPVTETLKRAGRHGGNFDLRSRRHGFDGFDPDADDPGIDHAERARRTGGHVDDPPADERPAVVDAAFD